MAGLPTAPEPHPSDPNPQKDRDRGLVPPHADEAQPFQDDLRADLPGDTDRLAQLLVDWTVFGLSDAEMVELHELLVADSPNPERIDLDEPITWPATAAQLAAELEQSAAQVVLANGAVDPTSLPAAVADRILQQAPTYLITTRPTETKPTPLAQQDNGTTTPPIGQFEGGADQAPTPTRATSTRSADLHQSLARSQFREAVAWFVAALSLGVLGLVWLRVGSSIPTTTPVIDWAAARAAFVTQRQESLVVAPWQRLMDAAAVRASGDLVWDQTSQTGFMRFSGLPVNDPAQYQYQLWIFDAQRDGPPVDGGVFNISDASETVVPIRAKLPVFAAAKFAITIEPPGGVVVSKQERVPLLAELPAHPPTSESVN